MLFKLLKLFGLDIPAKVAAAKSAIEQRAEEVADFAKEATQTAAVIAVLSVLAGISGAMALGVGLLEVYRVVAESYGVNTGLGVIAAVFVAVAVILLLIAWAKEQSLSNRLIFKPLTPFPAATSDSSAPVVVAEGPASASPAADGPRPEPARDLLEPLAYLLAKYIRYPALGNPVLDEFVGSLRATARGVADEAVERAANLVRYGNRGQLLVLLGGAAFAGWLLARQNEGLRDITADR
jgi:hypothetical protein